MKLTPVTGSTSIKAYAHDPATGQLMVQFQNGKTYTHENVPLEKVAAFTGAASMGAFYNAKIKGTYPHKRVQE
jgi:hypothetical protein